MHTDNLAMFLRHPWLTTQPLGRPGMGPGVIRKYERELRVVEGIGLGDVEMDGVVALVLGHAHGSAVRCIGSERGRRETGLDDHTWWRAVEPVLTKLITSEDLSVSGRVGEAAAEAYGGAEAADQGFAFGLSRILDGIQALIDRRS